MHSPPPGAGRGPPGSEGDEEADDILHCILDYDDDASASSDGVRILEIQGLDSAELRRVTDEVTANGGREGGSHRYAFPGAVKKPGRGNSGGGRGNLFEDANVLEVPPRRGHGRKYQAVNLPPKNDPSNPNNTLGYTEDGVEIRQRGHERDVSVGVGDRVVRVLDQALEPEVLGDQVAIDRQARAGQCAAAQFV